MADRSWWRGTRGEWYVVAQFALGALVLFGPRSWNGIWMPDTRPVFILSVLLMAWGLAFSSAAALRLGSNLTPLPRPKDDSTLVDTGPFRLVRHPIYSGIVFMAVGWALFVRGPLTLGYAAAVFLFLDFKCRHEERFLRERFPAYGRYQKKVRRLIPFVY